MDRLQVEDIVMVQTPPQHDTLTLELPQSIGLHVTQEQFKLLAACNRDIRLERTATGELVMTPPTGGESGKRNFNLIGQLARWCEAHEGLGEGFDSSTGFRLPNGADRSPDVAWVSRARWAALTPQQRKGFVPLCPDFVIELRSESDSLPKLHAKMQEYIDSGTRLGWLIDPQDEQVEVYRPGQVVEVLTKPMELSGDDVLPGFILKLNRMWE